MPTDKQIKNLVINLLTDEQYASATKNADELYLTPITDSNDGIPAIPTDKTESYYLNAVYDTTTPSSVTKWTAVPKVYDHYLALSGDNNIICWFEVVSTYSGTIHGTLSTQIENLNNLLGNTTRIILCAGVIKASDGTNPRNIIALNWRGTWDNSQFYTSDLSTVSTADAGFTKVNGTHYPLNIEDWK